jgi:hypothetical protein
MSTHDHFKTYLTALEQSLQAGNATEHTHRPALKALLEALGGTDIRATNEPRRIECGAPDYIVTCGVAPLGYVEAKDVGADLSRTENSDQLRRYRQALSNLILTDYFEFRWYLDGELRLTASLPQPGRGGRIHFNDGAVSEVAQLLEQFIQADFAYQSVASNRLKPSGFRMITSNSSVLPNGALRRPGMACWALSPIMVGSITQRSWICAQASWRRSMRFMSSTFTATARRRNSRLTVAKMRTYSTFNKALPSACSSSVARERRRQKSTMRKFGERSKANTSGLLNMT